MVTDIQALRPGCRLCSGLSLGLFCGRAIKRATISGKAYLDIGVFTAWTFFPLGDRFQCPKTKSMYRHIVHLKLT